MSRSDGLQIQEAIETFAHGFAATRSITHPYLVSRVDPLWMLHDAPRADRKERRNREYLACGTPPGQVVELIERTKPDRYALCVIHPGLERNSGIEQAYKGLRFRYARHEPVFVADVRHLEQGGPSPRVRRVRTADDAAAVSRAARRRQIPNHEVEREDADAALFAALDDGEPVGWVSSIRTSRDSAWVANLFVRQEHRGQGLGGALMRAMLAFDAERGVRFSVLTASQAGSRLYPSVGYRQIGTLQLFNPLHR